MLNIKPHKVNIPSKVIEKSWGVYSQKYSKIEADLISPLLLKGFQGKIHSTGAFQIGTKELKNLGKDNLITYFTSDQGERLVIKLKTKWIFRGADYYVGMQKGTNLQKTEIIFSRLVEILDTLAKAETNSSPVLYLALLDYARNYLMLLLYAIHQCARVTGVSKTMQVQYKSLLELVDYIERNYINALTESKISSDGIYPSFRPTLAFFRSYLKDAINMLSQNDSLHSDIYRRVREADNPIKLVNFAFNVANVYLPRNCVLVGIEYGGIELPFVVNAYRQLLGKSSLDTLSVNLSSYSVASKRYIDEIGDALSPFSSIKNLDNYDSALILDDSVTTGRTVEYLSRLLPSNIKHHYFRCISFTNTNRYHHLTRFEHGGVNPFIFEELTALYPSNYTQTYSKKKYTNRMGVFDKEKNRIVRMQQSYYPELIN